MASWRLAENIQRPTPNAQRPMRVIPNEVRDLAHEV